MRNFHQIVESCLAPLAIISMKGMQCHTKNAKRVLLQLMFTIYGADFSETDDLLDVKRGSRTPAPCYLCTANAILLLSQKTQNFALFLAQ